MNFKISENIKQTVIRLWLEGKSRKDIALITGVSEGTVSNIIAEWKQKLGDGNAEALRELGINLKRTGIDAAQCAQGFRISMIMRKMGINGEAFKSFISKVYERCQRVGLTPDKIGSYLEDLVEFSASDNNNAIKISEIPHHIEQMKNEKRKLKQDIQNLKIEKKQLEDEASYANELRDFDLEDEKTTSAEVKEYSNLKAELRRYGLSIEEDIPKFVQVVRAIKQQHGYDVNRVLSDYSDQEIMEIKRDLLSDQVKILEDTRLRLQNECYFLKSQVDLHRQRLYVYNKLKSMGFGLRELKIIYNTLKEIAAENNIIDHRQTVDKFFESLEIRYDIKIRIRVQKKQQLERSNDTKPLDNPIGTFPFYPELKSFTTLPKPATLVNQKQQERRMPWPSSISFTHRRIATSSKATDQLNIQSNRYPDELV